MMKRNGSRVSGDCEVGGTDLGWILTMGITDESNYLSRVMRTESHLNWACLVLSGIDVGRSRLPIFFFAVP